MAEIELNEKQSSITVSRNASGAYSFQVKVYFDEEGGKAQYKKINDFAERTFNDLKKRFEGKKVVRRLK